MKQFIFIFILSVVVTIIGIMNVRGNVSMLHKYHRKRVSEEDMLPFARLVGIGTIIVGVSLFIKSIFALIIYFSGNSILDAVGSIVTDIGLVVGLIVIFRAIKKYNKGIF